VKSAGKKVRPLSDSRPPVRPPGEPTQTEFRIASDLRNLPIADIVRATAFGTRPQGYRLILTKPNKDIP
jgi:hypothetical protein